MSDIPVESYTTWVRDRDRYTIAGIPNRNAVWMNAELYPRNYRHGGIPQSGYSPACNSTRHRNINLNNYELSYPACRR